MIGLLHGPDVVSSREFLLKLKSQYDKTSTIILKKTAKFNELNFEKDLFSTKTLFVVENYTPKNEDKIVLEQGIDLIFWIDELVKIPSWVEKNWIFKLNGQATAFKLADYVSVGQERLALLQLEKLLQANTPPELIIGALVRQFRLMVLVLDDHLKEASQSEFLQSKLVEQSKKWNLRKIRNASFTLLKFDWGLKNSTYSKETLSLLVLDLCELPAN